MSLGAQVFGCAIGTMIRYGAWVAASGGPGTDQGSSMHAVFRAALQGTYDRLLPEAGLSGGAILQNAPLFPAVGNHEVSGRFRPNLTVPRNGAQHVADVPWMDNDPQPRWFAEWRYAQVADVVNPGGDPARREAWIAAHSHDHRT